MQYSATATSQSATSNERKCSYVMINWLWRSTCPGSQQTNACGKQTSGENSVWNPLMQPQRQSVEG